MQETSQDQSGFALVPDDATVVPSDFLLLNLHAITKH
jgi:hypothetical protein